MAECVVYRSRKRADTYLYLCADLSLDDLPEELGASFGQGVEVMRLDLTRETRLAQVEAAAVLTALEDPGYFLQLPPRVSVEELITRKFG